MDSSSSKLPVVVRAPQSQVVPWGAGRTMSEFYNACGRYVGKAVGQWAHRAGFGPNIVAKRIEEYFENRGEVLLDLIDLRRGANSELTDNCMNLMKFTLPNETMATQLTAFKRIVALTSRFIGLRIVLLRCRHLQATGISKADIVKLWTGVELPSSDHAEWSFYLEFAASCVSDEAKLAVLLEDKQLDEVADVSGTYSVVEQLLVASESCDGFEQWIAIRYLGRILEPHTFWVQESHDNHQIVIKKLFERGNQLVEDQGVEHPLQTNDLINPCADVQGIDIFASALVKGARLLDQDGMGWSVLPRPSLELFSRLLGLLRQPGARRLLPRSFCTAASQELNALFSISNRYELADILLTDDGSGTLDSISTSVPRDPGHSMISYPSEFTQANKTVDESTERAGQEPSGTTTEAARESDASVSIFGNIDSIAQAPASNHTGLQDSPPLIHSPHIEPPIGTWASPSVPQDSAQPVINSPSNFTPGNQPVDESAARAEHELAGTPTESARDSDASVSVVNDVNSIAQVPEINHAGIQDSPPLRLQPQNPIDSSGTWAPVPQSVPRDPAHATIYPPSEFIPGNRTIDKSTQRKDPELADAPENTRDPDVFVSVNDVNGITQAPASTSSGLQDSPPSHLQRKPPTDGSRTWAQEPANAQQTTSDFCAPVSEVFNNRVSSITQSPERNQTELQDSSPPHPYSENLDNSGTSPPTPPQDPAYSVIRSESPLQFTPGNQSVDESSERMEQKQAGTSQAAKNSNTSISVFNDVNTAQTPESDQNQDLPGSFPETLQAESQSSPRRGGILHFMKNLFAHRVKVDEINNEDIIIVVVGPAGSGKSSFINIATKDNQASINHGEESSTGEVQGVKCMYPDESGRSVVFVDTPAFNHDKKSVSEIGREIMKWMTKTYDRKNKVAGILYLHRISDVRLTESPFAHLMMFQQSWDCYVLPQRVMLATTMWSQVDPETGDHREEKIRGVWEKMIALGSGMTRFDHTTESAWKIVDLLLGAAERNN